MKSKKPPGIIISGYYGFGNAGDEAILSAMISSLKHFIPDADITVISANPRKTLREHGVKSIHRKDIWKIFSCMESASLFISGGGGLIQDVTSFQSLAYYLGMIFIAKLMGKKAMIFAQGIGPVNTRAGKLLTRLVANSLNLITVRDQNSRRILRQLGVNKPPIIITADPVLALEPAPTDRILEIMSKEGIPSNGLKIAISARPWPTAVDFPMTLAKVADIFVEREKAFPVLFPFQRAQDTQVCREIAHLMKHPAKIIENEYNASEMLGLIGKMDMLIGMRLHSVIFSALMNVSMIGVAYDPKVKSFLERISAPYISLEKLTEENLQEAAMSLWSRRNNFIDELKGKVEILREHSMENFRIVSELLEGRSPDIILEGVTEDASEQEIPC